MPVAAESAPVQAREPLQHIAVGEKLVPLSIVRNRRARRYILRLRSCGTARLTIPRGGSEAEGKKFAGRHIPWLKRQLRLLAEAKCSTRTWLEGTEILFRGELVKLRVETQGARCVAWLGSERIPVSKVEDLRPEIERHLRNLANRELPARVLQLANEIGFKVGQVSVRNQKSRWGSCSARRTVALNWRFVQSPEHVRDYIIMHELVHLRHMNHSPAFWEEVARLCPRYEAAERWLKGHSHLLR